MLYVENFYFRRTISVIRGLSGACYVGLSVGPLVMLSSKMVKIRLLRILDYLDSAKYHQNAFSILPSL